MIFALLAVLKNEPNVGVEITPWTLRQTVFSKVQQWVREVLSPPHQNSSFLSNIIDAISSQLKRRDTIWLVSCPQFKKWAMVMVWRCSDAHCMGHTRICEHTFKAEWSQQDNCAFKNIYIFYFYKKILTLRCLISTYWVYIYRNSEININWHSNWFQKCYEFQQKQPKSC